MEFPSRSGGAQGGLIKGNLFAQSGAPAYSNTLHGDGVIHTMDGRISITRKKTETLAPYLLLPYYLNDRPRLLRTAIEPSTPEFDDAVAERPTQFITGRGVFVGDGYFLCMERDPEGKRARPVLVSIADSERASVNADQPGANVMGASVQLNTEWLLHDSTAWGDIFPSYLATGWRDATRRYGFAVFGVLDDGVGSFYASRYVCIVGDTGTRTTKMYHLPTRPNSAVPLLRRKPLSGNVAGETPKPAVTDYRTSWWGCEAIYPSQHMHIFEATEMVRPARCYCVGRGHLLALLVPQERICSYTEYFGLGPSAATTLGVVTPSWLPPGSAPYLLRSRDFGETWTMEKADFLVSGEPPSADNFVLEFLREAANPASPGWITNPYRMENAVIPSTLQRVSSPSHFIASPLGEGKVAIAALGPYQGTIHQDETVHNTDQPWWSASGRGWRFYVSSADGAGFTKKPFPMDAMRAREPNLMVHAGNITAGPSERTFEVPLFNAFGPAPRAYSFAPGHFVWSSIKYRVTGANKTSSGLDWGEYPRDYPVTVWATHDYGETWTASRMPAELMRGARDLEDYRKLYPRDRWGASEMWVATTLAFGAVAPESEGGRPTMTYMTWHLALDGADIYVSDDPDDPIGSLVRVAGLPYSPAGATVFVREHSSAREIKNDNTYEVFYTGDFTSGRYPELVYPGYQEFEEP